MTELCEGLTHLDWNERWKAAAARRWQRTEKASRYWDKRAPSFGERNLDSAYAKAFLEALKPEPEWTILDVGCGTGALALPMAGSVRRITAVDFSEGMLRELDRCALNHGITNIQTKLGAWEDDWETLGLGVHDVAIASRSLVVDDLETALRKLDASARHRVLITSIVGDGPRDRRAMEAVGRNFPKGPDYIYVVNLLHQMGIYANVTFIDTEREWAFASRDEARDFYNTYLGNLDSPEEVRLEAYLDRELVHRGGRWTLRHPDVIRWALISWKKPVGEIQSEASLAL